MSSQQRQHSVLIACGGSGGHLIPGLVVRAQLIARGYRVLLSVSDKEVDKKILKNNQIEAEMILPANRSAGPALIRAVRLVLNLIFGTLRARKFLQRNNVSFVLGMGGFNCVPPLFAARFLGIPCAIHESNVIPGKATRLLANRVNCTFLGFPQCEKNLPALGNGRIVGIPTRYDASAIKHDKVGLQKKFQLEPGKKTLLVLGGSQGSEFINRQIFELAPFLAQQRDNIQILHITGKAEPINASNPIRSAGIHRIHFEYHNAMDELYSLADVVIARSGAGVIAEVLEFGLKAVFIPLPTAADNHQLHNALAVQRSGHIEVLEQKEASPQRLLELLNKLLASDEASASQKKQKPARPEILMADVIEKLIEGRQT